jgi:hypothetical protein
MDQIYLGHDTATSTIRKEKIPNCCDAKAFFVLVLINRFSLACDVLSLAASVQLPFQLREN